MKKEHKDLERLLTELYDLIDPDPGIMDPLAEEIFALDPENPETLLFLADHTEDPQKATEYLSRCVESTRNASEENGYAQTFLFEALQRLGWHYIIQGQGEEAAALGTELLSLESDDYSWAKAIRSIGLILSGQHTRVLETVIAEEDPDVFSAHVKAIALLERSRSLKESAAAIWDAIRKDPNLPFYLLNFWDIPEEEEEEELETYSRALLLEPAWTSSDHSVMALSTATVFFGYITERIPEELLDEIEEELQKSPVFTFLEMARERVMTTLENSEDFDQADLMALDILSTMDDLFL